MSINIYCACGFVAFNIFKQVVENSAGLIGLFPLHKIKWLSCKKMLETPALDTFPSYSHHIANQSGF